MLVAVADMSPASLGHLRRWAALPFCSTLAETPPPPDADGELQSAAADLGVIKSDATVSLSQSADAGAEGEEPARAVRRAVRRLIGYADTGEAQEQLRLCALNGCC